MPDLTDAQVNEACARFCGWTRSEGGWVSPKQHSYRIQCPDYRNAVNASKLMRAISETEYDLNIEVWLEHEWRIILGANGHEIDLIAPDWKVVLARAVAAMQLEKEKATP